VDQDDGAMSGQDDVVNSVACRPDDPSHPKVRTPSPEAIGACHGRLVRDLGSHDRSVIVALGMTAIKAVLGLRGYRVMEEPPGTELPSEWGPVVPTLHPAYVLRHRVGGPESERLVADLKYARGMAVKAGGLTS
jgi:uracil-DNA glycosylase family 4